MHSQQDSQRVLFDTVDLEGLIPDDHLPHRIDARIDFVLIDEVTKVCTAPIMAATRSIRCCFSGCS